MDVDLKVDVKEKTPDMNGGDEGSDKLCVARDDSPSAFEGAEDDFNENIRNKLRSISLPVFRV